MKHTLALFFAAFLLAATSFAQSSQPSAEAVLKEATTQAAKEHKKVFIIFHASWCGWCHRMDSIMANADCKKLFADNFVIRHLTVQEAKGKEHLENPGGAAMMEKYQGKGKGIPFWLIFDAKGNLVADCLMRPEGAGLDKPGENTGCPATKEEVAHFVKVLKQTTPLNTNQLALIEKNFIKK
ncbi:thioredoxin family protein [Paraflavitalea soli]|uniref:Thioredoxin family protein n=1 Tax=Paraflavitalea soli TaxID=2315862 RepID=A0A3B7N2Y2_9BACT|nr:thioredoxin family protein [Paraflavitalea soli]AXY78415.1 thioredoxin family protein [Paraflavitalea soli]